MLKKRPRVLFVRDKTYIIHLTDIPFLLFTWRKCDLIPTWKLNIIRRWLSKREILYMDISTTDEWTFQNICQNLILYIAKLTGVSFDDMYCSLGVFLKWIVALHCESLKCWQTYLDRYHQIRIDFDEWTVQKGGMNSGHIKFFSTIKEIKINSMIKDISPIFSQQDPFGVVENTFASIRVLSSIWRQK